MMHFCMIAFKNLLRNVKRNLATGSAIAFGFCGVLMLGGYANRVQNYLATYTVYVIHTGHLALFAPNGMENFDFKPKNHSLSPQTQAAIENILKSDPNVEFFERQLWGAGLVGNGCVSLPFIAKGIEPETDKKIYSHPMVRRWMPQFAPILKGRELWNYPSSLGGVALSRRLARGLGKTSVHEDFPPGQVVLVDCASPDARQKFGEDANVQFLVGSWEGSINALDGEVVSLFTTGFDETDSSAIMASTEYLQRLYDTNYLGRYAIWLKHPGRLPETRERIRSRLSEVGEKVDIYDWDDQRMSPYYFGTVNFLDSLVGFISVVMGVVILFSVLNSTTMTILERSQEIGTYRALGFRRSQVRNLFVLESVWLGLLALLVGAILGVVVIGAINASKIIYYPPGASDGLQLVLILNPIFSLLAALTAMLLTIAGTWVVASSRLRQMPANLLSGVAR